MIELPKKKYKTLELFAGSRSFSKVAEQYGHEIYCTDIEDFAEINQVCDIFDFDVDKMLAEYGIPDIVWASPPCTYFSVASIGHHWHKDHTPKTGQALYGMEVVEEMHRLIDILKPKYYFIENPRGKLRKLPIMNRHKYMKTVTYCSYGDSRLVDKL
jgi:site-specific DNA-cytosine methylase